MANKLKYYREQAGLSQEALSEKAGVPVALIKRIEEGRQTMLSTVHIVHISEILSAEPTEIFGDEEAYSKAKVLYLADLCTASAETIGSIINALFYARTNLEEGAVYRAAEYSVLETAEIALEKIRRGLEDAGARCEA